MRRSRKPFRALGSDEGSNPSPSASNFRWLGTLAVAVGVVLLAPPAAAAHVRSSRSAVDFRASVLPLHGVGSARAYESDLALRLTVAAGNKVVVLGYLGEPAIRIDPAGVAVNAASPTAAGIGLLQGPAGRAGGPVWQHRSSERSVVWHDNRLRGLPAGVDRGRWSVPLVVNGRPSRLAGTIWRVPAPAAWPWFVLGIPFIGATALLFLFGDRRRFRVTAVSFGTFSAICAVASAAGFVFDTYSSEGKWSRRATSWPSWWSVCCWCSGARRTRGRSREGARPARPGRWFEQAPRAAARHRPLRSSGRPCAGAGRAGGLGRGRGNGGRASPSSRACSSRLLTPCNPLGYPARTRGEVAEWLKAAPC
jgi:hypothetical protein